MNGRPLDAVVIGAGPYALAAAAHLRESGADIRVLGRPMSFWREHMPRGMRIRSRWNASHIAHPRNDLSLDAYESALGRPIERPMPLADFIAYAGWFQQHVAPDVDARDVARVHARSDGFRVVLADGESIDCRRVVVAAGISAFAWRPPEFADLPRELASHSSDHSDLGVFAAKRVVVIGGGQSAIESAALLHEAGADVEVIMRRPVLRWVGRATREGLLGRVFFHRTDVGPALVSHLVARPALLRLLPEGVQQEVTRRSLAPGASLWLRPRVSDVRMTNGRHVAAASRTNAHLSLRLDDGSTREIDHALLATGFRIDVRRYAFLDPVVLGAIRCLDGYPVLGPGLESSVPGLHFLGAPAARTFGPLLRFVSGSGFATRSLVRGVTRRAAVTGELDGDAPFESAPRERRST
jgi:cation diffusion facilitator CzcD-associated flavoprotein CzcO